MISVCPQDAITNWNRSKNENDRAYYFSVVETEDTSISTSPYNTIGWDSKENLDEYAASTVVGFLEEKKSAGAVFSDDSVSIILIFSKRLGLIYFTPITIEPLSFQEYIKRGIPKKFRLLKITHFVMEPTVKEMCDILGEKFKVVLGTYSKSFSGYIK